MELELSRLKAARARENHLARLIFSATDLTSVYRLHQYLDSHPELWTSLSGPVRGAIEKAILDYQTFGFNLNDSRADYLSFSPAFPLFSI